MDNSGHGRNELSRHMGRIIVQLNRRRKRFMGERLRVYGLSGSMYMFITALDWHPGASQDWLVNHFYMDKGNVARSAKKLETAGYIRREIDPCDRRQYNLFLTDEGRNLLPIIRGYISEWYEKMTDGFTDDECVTALNLLERMIDNSSDKQDV